MKHTYSVHFGSTPAMVGASLHTQSAVQNKPTHAEIFSKIKDWFFSVDREDASKALEAYMYGNDDDSSAAFVKLQLLAGAAFKGNFSSDTNPSNGISIGAIRVGTGNVFQREYADSVNIRARGLQIGALDPFNEMSFRINQKLEAIALSMNVCDVKSIDGIEDVLGQGTEHLRGYFAELRLNDVDVIVPNVLKFKDRNGEAYSDEKHGRFNAPLLNLTEWQGAYNERDKPTLLVNANWFNVWRPGEPNHERIRASHRKGLAATGIEAPNDDVKVEKNLYRDALKKYSLFNERKFDSLGAVVSFSEILDCMNVPDNARLDLRQDPRSFLSGLSVSNGEIVSSHRELDQGGVPLDTVVFDSKSKIAALLSNSEIQQKLDEDPNYFDGKSAVSGFIIIRDGEPLNTPEKNNSHGARTPRTGIGIKEDGSTVVVMSIYHDCKCETRLQHENQYALDTVNVGQFSALFKKLGCIDAINLDNSGSVEFLYSGSDLYGSRSAHTVTSDIDQGKAELSRLSERPKPNFIGFRNSTAAHKFYFEY
ncbi:phosphodiester glycosidase family protein [Burkholderia ubonensis]|uniref:phosphodiester glycosidase family protein n=1 Tax=Burkholderia ubonensis TaxID=101571 RepID=UPI0009B3FD0E|nr:phosphodiester glycosidase family protein [Burkholderia ubonensis]